MEIEYITSGTYLYAYISMTTPYMRVVGMVYWEVGKNGYSSEDEATRNANGP